MENTSENKICKNCKKDFIIETEDFKFYEKIKVPPPTFCPECRMQRRFISRNERNLYHRECNLCKKNIISMYSKETLFPVYCPVCWWGDGWDPMEYSVNVDFSQIFFSQYLSLFNKVARLSFNSIIIKNSDYCNYVGDAKDSYLCFGSLSIENCLYGSPYYSKYCVDNYLVRDSEYCYECIDCEKLAHCIFCQDCSNSLDLIYCFDCKNCNDCIGCVGIRGQKYQIFNVQYSKEEYFLKKSELLDIGRNGFRKIEKIFYDIKLKFPHKFSTILYSTDIEGDHIVQSKNAKKSFDIKDCKDVKYCKQMISAKDVFDINYCEFPELSYEYIGFWKVSQTKFSNTCGESNNIFYSDFCSNSHNLFACIGLRNKSYCILNKQYTKEEYESLVPKIIKHMNDMPYIDSKGRVYKYGEFFPSELSPFCYNETIAQEYFPLTKEQAIEQGYKWKERVERDYNIDIKNEDIPNDIKEVDESIIGKVIECNHSTSSWQAHNGTCNEQCTEAFKIVPQELQFYQRMNLPLPRLCPNCRHYNRLKQRNPLKLWHRQCMKEGCTNTFETSYAPERPEIVYCERCYQQEVY